MKQLILLIILVFTSHCFTQENDSISIRLSSLFGSDCDLDTLVLKTVKESEIVFYKKENKLIRIKNGKIKWAQDLTFLLQEQKCQSLCILQKGVNGKPRKTYVFVLSDHGRACCAIRCTNGKFTDRAHYKNFLRDPHPRVF